MRRASVQIIAATVVGFVGILAPHVSLAQVQWQVVPPPAPLDFPQRAMHEGLSGRATVSCDASSQGVIENCEIVSETPEGYGFGLSAVQIVQRGRLVPSADGQPYEGFQITVPFTLDVAIPAETDVQTANRKGIKSPLKPRS